MRKGRILLSVVGFSAIALLTAGSSLADRKTDIGQLFADWYNRKLSQAMSEINGTFQSETELQIDRYRQELQAKLDQASGRLEHTKQEEMQKRLNMLRSYADSLITGIHAADPRETKQMQAKLDAILSEARQSMEEAVHNERVTGSTYHPKSPKIRLQHRKTGVTDSVYSKNLPK